MKHQPMNGTCHPAIWLAILVAVTLGSMPSPTYASGGSGSGGGGITIQVDSIKVSKCYYNTGGEMLIKASSSDAAARLFAYRPDGTYAGEVQNGGGSRYGGTAMPYIPYDPGYMTIKSSSGGSVNAPTTPFQI
ncbi:MAG: hypothetical protein DVB31_13850 [Verrucomicrobia bacterium]|nr:MAG: hypothetical protein DVB31_13850 [Verrucomicrobiota bacterium]